MAVGLVQGIEVDGSGLVQGMLVDWAWVVAQATVSNSVARLSWCGGFAGFFL